MPMATPAFGRHDQTDWRESCTVTRINVGISHPSATRPSDYSTADIASLRGAPSG